MPAHLECPDIYAFNSITNILSTILLDRDFHPAALANLNNVARLDGIVPSHELTIPPHAALVDQAPRLAIGGRESSLHHSLDDADWEPRLEFDDGHIVRSLASAELAVPVLLRAGGG